MIALAATHPRVHYIDTEGWLSADDLPDEIHPSRDAHWAVLGPRLANGDYLLLAGTDNDYSVTQNGTGEQFDVYFRFTDADPYLGAIQCPLGQTTGCTGAASAVPGDGSYRLLPGVLHAYTLSAAELGDYVAPIPEPGSFALIGLGLAGLAGLRRRRQ